MASNKALVPEAKKALDQFKMEAATEVGVTLNQGYNGDLTARQAGSIGGQMVNNMNPVRTMKFDRHNRISQGHKISDCCRSIKSLVCAYTDYGRKSRRENEIFFR